MLRYFNEANTTTYYMSRGINLLRAIEKAEKNNILSKYHGDKLRQDVYRTFKSCYEQDMKDGTPTVKHYSIDLIKETKDES